MAFLARCPYCGQRSRVPPQSEGSSGQCPRCAAFYTLVPEDESAPASPSAPPADAPAPPLSGAPRAVVPGAFVQAHGNGAETGGAPRRRAASRGWLAGLGVAALLLASAALMSASFLPLCRLVIPLSAAGLLLGLAGLWWGLMVGTGKRALLLPAAASMAAGVVLLIAKLSPGMLGPVYQASRPRPAVDATAMQVLPLPGSRGLENARPDWVDASKAVLRQGGTMVKISRVWIGLADPGKKPSAADKQPCLFVRVQVFQAKPAKEKGALPRPAPASRPKLTDDAGQAYEFRDGVSAPAEKPAKSPELSALGGEEVFAFAPPAPNLHHLRIEMPADRWQATGFFRFTIPSTMIDQAAR